MKTYNEFLTEAAEQKRVPGGYIWIEEIKPGEDMGVYKVTADGPGGKRVTIKDNIAGYKAARTAATGHMRKIMVDNPSNKFAAKVFRKIGNKLHDPFA
jgi:hypothetical protein